MTTYDPTLGDNNLVQLTAKDFEKNKKTDDNGDPLTEDALALRFSERHDGDLRHIAVHGHWLRWDGSCWRKEETSLAFDLVRKSCRNDAQQYGNGKPERSVYSAKTVAAVERMATPRSARQADDPQIVVLKARQLA